MATATRNGTTIDYQTAALAGYDAGLCIVPAAGPNSKQPKKPLAEQVDGEWTWEHYQRDRPDREKVAGWFARNTRRWFGVVCGKVSGNVEAWDFDDRETYERTIDKARALGLGDLIDAIEAGYCDDTPNGVRWLTRCDTIEGPLGLAHRPLPDGELQVLIETRGEGAFAVVAPTTGLHPDGQSYRRRSGKFSTVITITPEQREALLALCRSMDETPAEIEDPWSIQAGGLRVPGELPDGKRPGDDFNDRATWAEVLEPAGWKKVGTKGDETFWRRPGKSEGLSATTGVRSCGEDLLFVFSTSTAFTALKCYRKFSAFTLLNHGGNPSAAAKAIHAAGYGSKGTTGRDKPKRAEAARRKASSPPPSLPQTSQGFAPTDLGNAERFAAQHGANVRYCHPWRKWLVFLEGRWQVDTRGEVQRRACQTVRTIYAEAGRAEADDRRRELAEWAQASERRERINAMLGLAESQPGIPIMPADMDRDPWAFNVANGTVDLRTGQLRPHRREDLITRLCPWPYDPAAACPLWDATQSKFFAREDETDREDLIGYWRRLCGSALPGLVREQVLPIAFGTGANGKSTMLNALVEAMGPDYAMKAPPDLLMARKTESHPTERADLFGRRLVICVETGEGRRLNETLVKELTGGDIIRARRMREDFWEFAPSHLLIVATNHRPEVRGTDKGIWRRLKLIPFVVSVDESTADKSMPEKLREEMPGILAWCVRGCLEWQRVGLGEPDEVSTATSAYRSEQDTLGAFIEEATVRLTDARTKAADVYARYRSWCESAGENPLNLTRFGNAMRERGFEKHTSNGVWYRGLGLREVAADEAFVPFARAS
jgi:P4 family phage/plasmid primase-like protien